MKAAVFKGIGQSLVVEEVRDPVPDRGEVIVEVGHCGICGSDLHMTQDPIFATPAGTVLGHEYSGEIVAVGNDVTTFAIGDRVAVMPLHGCGHCAQCLAGRPSWCAGFKLDGGGYAQFTRAAAHQCIRLPRGLSLPDAALAEPLAVALHGVTLARIAPGARVLVIGAGPIGLGVAYWARRLGAAGVVVTDLVDMQAERAAQMGATDFFLHDEGIVARVAGALGGAPDVVFECVGRPGLIAQALAHVRPRGIILILGLCTSPDSFVPFEAVAKEVRLQTSAFFHEPDFRAAIDALSAGAVAPRALITDEVTLTAMPPMFEALRRRTTQCKVLVNTRAA